MLWQVETVGYLFLHLLVGEVVIELGKCTKGGQFERLPSWGKLRLVVVTEMLFDEIFLGAGYLAVELILERKATSIR